MKIKGTYPLIGYGPFLVMCFYITWVAGKISLGNWPRPSLDDPKDIKGFWMWTYDFTGVVLCIGLPVVCVLAGASIVWPLLKKSPQWKARLTETMIGIILLALAIAFIRWDPQHVVEWYMD
jgi:hypothetical protein